MNSEYRDYTKLAYKKAIIAAVRRYLLGFVQGDISTAEGLQSDDVLAADREVPEDAFHDFLEELQGESDLVSSSMSQFEFRRKLPRGKSEDKKVPVEEAEVGAEEGDGEGGLPTPSSTDNAGGSHDKGNPNAASTSSAKEH